jgi:hypothetical protein
MNGSSVYQTGLGKIIAVTSAEAKMTESRRNDLPTEL